MSNYRNFNLYSVGKSILANAITIGDWWKIEQDWNTAQQAFGLDALRRGVEQALNQGESVPDEVQRFVGLPISE